MLVYHVVLIGLLIGTAAVLTILSILNVGHGRKRLLSGVEDGEWVDVDNPERTADYQLLKTGFGALSRWLGLGALLLVLYTGVFRWGVQTVENLGIGSEVVVGVVFFLGLAGASELYDIPFDLFDTFVIEELFEFNQQSVRLWLRDKAVGLLLQMVMIAAVGAITLSLIRAFPSYWWALCWVVFTLLSLVMMVVYPRVIAPLFNDFTPIEQGELRDAVVDVFDSAGFECEQVYTMDASKRSSKANAYFVGFGRAKRVVLFDTLVEQMDTEEVKGVLAHELAHWQQHHIWKRIAASSLKMFVGLFVVAYLLRSPWLYGMFGIPVEATYAGLVLAGLWIRPLSTLASPLDNRLSIKHEYEADRFAAEVVGDAKPMMNALTRLVNENLSNPFPHPWYVAFHYDHPPVPDRIRQLDAIDLDE